MEVELAPAGLTGEGVLTSGVLALGAGGVAALWGSVCAAHTACATTSTNAMEMNDIQFVFLVFFIAFSTILRNSSLRFKTRHGPVNTTASTARTGTQTS
jgi:hypothetical protein